MHRDTAFAGRGLFQLDVFQRLPSADILITSYIVHIYQIRVDHCREKGISFTLICYLYSYVVCRCQLTQARSLDPKSASICIWTMNDTSVIAGAVTPNFPGLKRYANCEEFISDKYGVKSIGLWQSLDNDRFALIDLDFAMEAHFQS